MSVFRAWWMLFRIRYGKFKGEAGWEEIDSPSIARALYIPYSGGLFVELRKTGDIYSFSNISPETYAAFVSAESPAQYFVDVLKPRQDWFFPKKPY